MGNLMHDLETEHFFKPTTIVGTMPLGRVGTGKVP
jgi:hypothetical protein